jgi:acetate kinase
VAQTYALPQDVHDAGVRHWGNRGISYDYISRQIPKFAPHARRVIAAHLGGGASMCAMLDGHSVETTMGFGAISGLPMATRSGNVPAAAVFYLLRRKLFDDVSLEKMLYERAGLVGLAGISGVHFVAGGTRSLFHLEVIPRLPDQNRWAQSRKPMDMMVQG